MYTAYQTEKLSDHLYVIKETVSNVHFPIRIFLVVGENRAALIDTGLGTGDLRAEVRKITNLPVIVLHTHGHIDHTGADSQFNPVYLSEKEPLFFYQEADWFKADKQRLSLIHMQLQNQAELYNGIVTHRVRPAMVKFQKIEDGDLFDLGNLQLQAVATPGHTLGSLSFVNQQDGYAFTGDGIANIHWFDQKSEASVESFLQMLRHFEKQAGQIARIFAAHLSYAFDLNLVHDLQQAAVEILQGAHDVKENADYQFLHHGVLYAHHTGAATLYYDKPYIRMR